MGKKKIISVVAVWRTGAYSILAAIAVFCIPLAVSAAIAGHAVVNELRIEGASGADDDWVELYNPTASAIPLSGWSLQKFSAGGSTKYVQPLAGTLPAGGYFLVVRDGADTAQSLKDKADLLADDSFSLAADNVVYLVNGSDAILPASPDASIIDYVGFGSASFHEGAAAPAVSTGKSLSRVPDGEDTDDNFADFALLAAPTPQNSGLNGNEGNDLTGTVLVTVTPDIDPVRSVTAVGATIVFRVNTDGTAIVEYGPDDAYGSQSAETAVVANSDVSVDLYGLSCGQVYHYRINAANAGNSSADSTADAEFATLPCGISIDALTMTRPGARANDDYAAGWEWRFDITVWDLSETGLKMEFGPWSGPMPVDAGGNMRYSVDNGASWIEIADNGAYPANGAAIGTIDTSAAAGRQLSILVQMKVPPGTLAGNYGTTYGIETE